MQALKFRWKGKRSTLQRFFSTQRELYDRIFNRLFVFQFNEERSSFIEIMDVESKYRRGVFAKTEIPPDTLIWKEVFCLLLFVYLLGTFCCIQEFKNITKGNTLNQ